MEVIHDQPDGTNINAGCGSTHPDDLRRAVVTHGADVGLAFDGDADRVLAIDATGRLIDGDQIIGICAIDRRAHGRLAKDTVVVTVMTNLGFRLGMAEHGVEVLEVPVGDRYVLEAMADGGLSLGGEQSGHVVFADLATTGDGLLTAIQLLDIVRRSGRPLADLADSAMTRLPQVLQNVQRRHEGLGRHHGAGRRHRGGGGRARRPRPSADPRERHRAARPRDGRGPHPRAGGGRGRPPGRVLWRASGRADPAGTLVRSPNRKATTSRVRHHRPPPRARRPARPPALRRARPPRRGPATRSTTSTRSPRPTRAAELLEELDDLLRSPDGVALLVRNREVAARTEAVTAVAGDWVASVEGGLDAHGAPEGHSLESANASLLRLKDALWAVARDRLPTATAVRELVGESRSWSAIEVGTSIQQALSALDRLEVRGRDSAGLTVLVRDHGLDLDDPAVARLVAARSADHLFRSNAVRTPEGHLSFVYKAAAEIGELGDNTAAMRADVLADDLLRLALTDERASAVVLGHTRWASIGIISQPNAHPVDSLELDGSPGPYVTAALNGDVDNFADLKAADGLRLAAEITTDAKVIPTLVSHRLAEGADLTTAFRDTVASFEGSVAIAASAATHPDHVLLALRGSGQALYVGLADGCFVVASEPYGLVELTRDLPAARRRHARQPREPQRQPRSDRRPRRHRGRPARGDHPPGLRRHRAAR